MANNVIIGVPGPQGPPGPTGPTGPGGGGSSGNNVSIIGNVAGAPSLISSGTLFLAGGNNVTLSQAGQSVTISGGIQAGIGTTTATQAGSTLGATLSTNGLSLAVPAWITTAGAGGIAASMGGNTAGVAGLVSSGTLVLAGGNNVTLSQNGNSITISANTAAAANLSVSAGSTSGAFGGVTFANGSGVSFGLNNGTITGSVNSTSGAGLGTTFAGANLSGSMTLNTAGLNLSLSAPNESGIGLSAAGSSQSAGALVLSNSNGLSFGMNGSTVTASYNSTQFAGSGTTFSGTNISGSMTLNSAGLNLALSGAAGGAGASTGGIYAAGNTTGQSSSSTFPQSSLNLSFAGILSGGWSSNTFVISSPGTTGLTQLSAGMSTGGNTAGTTGLASAQLVLAGGANITLSGSTNAGSMTISIAGGAGGGASVGVSTGGNTSGNTGTYSGQVVFAGGNNITLSVSSGAAGAQTITISGANAGGAQTGISGIVVSNTTYTSGTVSFSNANGISFGSSAGQAITASYTQSAQAFSAQGGSSTFSTLAFTNSNGVSFSNTNGSIWGSVAAQTNQTLGLYAVGNTTQNSSTTLDARTLSFDALGAMTAGFSNGSIQLSAPATSSISGTGLVSVSINGSTISVGAAIPQLSFFQPLGPVQSTTVTQNGLGSIQLYPAIAAFPFSASRVDMMASVSLAVLAASTEAQTLSMYVGLYSLNGSTLSLASSGSQSYAWTNNSGGSSASISGIRRFSAPINVNYTGGFDLFVGLMSNTTFANTNGISLSNVVVPLGPGPQLQGLIGQTQVNSMQFVPGQGFFSATSAALPASIGLSQISGAGSGGNAIDFYAPVQFVNMTA